MPPPPALRRLRQFVSADAADFEVLYPPVVGHTHEDVDRFFSYILSPVLLRRRFETPEDLSTNVTISDAGINTNGKTHGKTNEAEDNKRKNSHEVKNVAEPASSSSQRTADTDTLAKKRKM